MSLAKGSIVLTGFMGTGKSSVGMALAQQLGLEFFDTDAIIESEHGPLEQLRQTQGADGFTEIERSVLRRVLEQPGRVIATGGSTVLDPDNARALASSGLVYCLVASPQEIARRMDAVAPASQPGDTDTMTRVTQLLTERLPAYGQFPQVRTDGRSPEAIANEIANDAANRGLVRLGRMKKERKASPSALKVGAAAFVVVALAAAIVLLLTRGDDAQVAAGRDVAPPSPDLPVGAPEGDEYFDIVLVNQQSRQAEERVQDWFGFAGEDFGGGGFGEQLLTGSVVHVVSVGSRVGTIEVYEWEATTNFPGERPEELRCTGSFTQQGRSGGQNCFPLEFEQQGPMLNWSGIDNGRSFLSTIMVSDAPEDGAWMVTEMRGGFITVSAVVGGYGYSEFDGRDGEPGTVRILDANLDELWSERMF